MALSGRLQLVYDHLIPDQDVWDFCCDHGYLGGTAYKSERFKDIYFVDPVPNIMENLKSRLQTFVYTPENKSNLFFLTQKGETIEHFVCGSVSIIGVGGSTICDILKGLAKNNRLKAQRLICGPHRDTGSVPALIESNELFKNYRLSSLPHVIENGRKREFFIFDLL